MKKQCRYCSETKYLCDFTRNANSPDGYSHFCKGCLAEYRIWLRFKQSGVKLEERKTQMVVRSGEFIIGFD